jgi:hypothetical protein
MLEIFTIVGLTVGYFAWQALSRVVGRDALWLVFGVVPVVLSPGWWRTQNFDAFVWLKIYSVVFAICWATWLRYSGRSPGPALRMSVVACLGLNIAEATVKDLLGPGWPHLFNAFAGYLLLVTMPRQSSSVSMEICHPYSDLCYSASRKWIMGYTLWNWTFVYLNYPAFVGHHTAVLAAALVVGIHTPRLWLQARAATLGFNLLFMGQFGNGLLTLHDASAWYANDLALVVASASLSWMLAVAGYPNTRGQV